MLIVAEHIGFLLGYFGEGVMKTEAPKTLWEQVEDVRKDAAVHEQQAITAEQQARQFEASAQEHRRLHRECLKRAATLLADAAAENGVSTAAATPQATIPMPQPTGSKKLGRPKNAKAGRPKKAAVAAAKSPKDDGQPSSNGSTGIDVALAKRVWEVLGRRPAALRNALPSYPEGAQGLTAAEIKTVIDSDSGKECDSSQIAEITRYLRHENLIGRNDSRRYYPIAGAKFNLGATVKLKTG